LYRTRCQPVRIPEPGQQIVPEVSAQPSELRRHRWLAQADLFRGFTDAALFEQRIQSDQQIQVQVRKIHTTQRIHAVDTSHHRFRLP
jgi:hypothetical protein